MSYASRAVRTGGQVKRNIPNIEAVNNKLPNRPCTAFLTPSTDTSASSVFEALDKANITDKYILCLHRRQGGEVQITFRTKSLKEKFLSLNSIKINNGHYALQEVDKPLTFLTIYDAPYELPDLAICKCLQPCFEVIHSRRGRYSLRPSVCNGLRHYRVRIINLSRAIFVLALFWSSCGATGSARRAAAAISHAISLTIALMLFVSIVSRQDTRLLSVPPKSSATSARRKAMLRARVFSPGFAASLSSRWQQTKPELLMWRALSAPPPPPNRNPCSARNHLSAVFCPYYPRNCSPLTCRN